MSVLLLFLATLTGLPATQGPCVADHYGRVGYRHEHSMERTIALRQICPGSECIKGFYPRADVAGYMAIRWADRRIIATNPRALVRIQMPWGGSKTVWLQPADYQYIGDVTSSQCRIETSAALAMAQGWSLWQGWGSTTARILRWER